MSLSVIRNLINTLQRKFARELAVVRARRVAEKFCDQWAAARNSKKPLPDFFVATGMLRREGVSGATFVELNQYLNECRKEGRSPEVPEFLHSVLCKPPFDALIRSMLRWDLPARKPSNYRPTTAPFMAFPILF